MCHEEAVDIDKPAARRKDKRERDAGVGERGLQDVTSRQRHRWNKLKASFPSASKNSQRCLNQRPVIIK
jgi:hypothetical protein